MSMGPVGGKLIALIYFGMATLMYHVYYEKM